MRKMADEVTSAMQDHPLRVGVLGTALIVKSAVIDAAPGAPGFVPAAIASRSLAKAEAYAATHGIPRAYGDYRALIDDPEIDAIYIPLPNNLHAKWSIASLEAGKPVLCEKPLSMNANEARAICEAVERTGSVFVEAFHYRYHPLIKRIRELLDTHTIGTITRMSMRAQVPGAWIPPDNIRLDPALGGGALMDLGIYCIDLLRHLAGHAPRILSAKAEQSRPDIDGTMTAELEFPGGIAADFRASHIFPESHVDSVIEIVGTHGVISAQKPFIPHSGGEIHVQTRERAWTEPADRTSTYTFQARAFVDQARRKCAVPTDARSGLANMEIVDSIYRTAGLRPRG